MSTCCDGRLSWFDGAEFATTQRRNDGIVCYFPHDCACRFFRGNLWLQCKFAVELLNLILRQDDFLYIWAWHRILREWVYFVSDYATFCINDLSGFWVNYKNDGVNFCIFFDKAKPFVIRQISKKMGVLERLIKRHLIGKAVYNAIVDTCSTKYNIIIWHASNYPICMIEELHFRYTISPFWIMRKIVVLKE